MAMTDNGLTDRNAPWRVALRDAMPAKERTALPRVQMPMQPADERVHNNSEVNLGLTPAQAVAEATRCLDCPEPGCIQGCPVSINIPSFIKNIQRGNIGDAARVLALSSSLPAVCGRVCPQERQCESRCIYLKMKKPAVAIGYLERYTADSARDDKLAPSPSPAASNGIKVAVAGSGPAGLSFAGEMVRLGYDVTVFEALHEIG